MRITVIRSDNVRRHWTTTRVAGGQARWNPEWTTPLKEGSTTSKHGPHRQNRTFLGRTLHTAGCIRVSERKSCVKGTNTKIGG